MARSKDHGNGKVTLDEAMSLGLQTQATMQQTHAAMRRAMIAPFT